MALTIDKNRCPQNHHCPLIVACPVEAMSQNGFELPKIDTEICIECGKCSKLCGMRAIYKIEDGETV